MNKKITKLTSTILLTTMLAYTTPILAFTKEETVYSKINTKGENYKTIVSTHLINDNEEQILNDLTDLINLENTNGDEELKIDGENVIWNANGSDIYYQGESQKELPIECKIKYELNGEEISADEIAGKSGKVKITIEYKNNDEHQVTINGKKQTMYTPFTAICMSYFDNSQNKNIEAKNAKVINDGTKTIIAGIAMPGMNESLNISNKKIEIPSKVEITMETSKFEQNNIITFVTPKILDESISFDKLNSLYKKVDEVMEASKQIEDGANALKEGTTEFSEKSQEFNDGMKALEAGTDKANNSYKEINSGINQVTVGTKELNTGAKELSNGLTALEEGLSSMPENINKLYNGSNAVLAGLNDNKATKTPGLVTGVNALAGTLNETISNLESSLNTMKSSCEEGITKLKQTNIALNSVIESLNTETQTTQIATLKQIVKGNEEQVKEYNAKIQYIDAQLKELNTKKAEGKKDIQKITSGMTEVQTGVSQITSGLSMLNDASSVLPENVNKLVQGSKKIATGTENLNKGTTALSAGSKQMEQGLDTLKESTTILANGSNALTEGVATINKGSIELAEGITTFNQEAISKICEFVNSDIKDIALRAEKLQELSEEYKNFSKANEDTAKEVKFILISDSVKEKEENENENN